MANSSAGNVRFVDTNDTTLADAKKICGIKYIGAASSSVTIKDGSATGNILWTDNGSTTKFEEVAIQVGSGIHVAVVGTASVYIYLK